jgi:hypothetical protein
MDLRNKINSGLTFFWTYSLCGLIPLFAQTTFQRPNIILILADDLGYETLSANGGESYATPVLDGLAKSGARFTHAFANPVCTPTRVKLMTGKINLRNYTSFGALDNGEITFANQLKAAGYATAITGKWQLGESPTAPQQFGFDEALLWQHVQSDQFRTDAPYIGKKLTAVTRIPSLFEMGKKNGITRGSMDLNCSRILLSILLKKTPKILFFFIIPWC